MTDPDLHDDTSADYEQFATELLAQGRGAATVETGKVDDLTACNLIREIVDSLPASPGFTSASSGTSASPGSHGFGEPGNPEGAL